MIMVVLLLLLLLLMVCDSSARNRRLLRSAVSIGGAIVVVLGVVTCIFILRIVMTNTKGFSTGGVQLGGIVASILNAIQIQVTAIQISCHLSKTFSSHFSLDYECAV